MTWTQHGHHIPTSPTDDEQGKRPPVARCGGTHLCKKCKADFAAYLAGKKEPHVGEIKFDKPTIFRPVDGDVTAVQVSENNAQEVAEWSGGEVRSAGYSQGLAVVIPTLIAPEVVTVGNYVVKKGNRFSGAKAENFEPRHIHRPDLETPVGETAEAPATQQAQAVVKGTYHDVEDRIRRQVVSGGTYERSADDIRYFGRSDQGEIVEEDRAGNELDTGPNGSWPPSYVPNKPKLGE